MLTDSEKAERLWPRVNIQGPDDCWEWTGAKTSGYGLLCIERKSVMAHRLSWELYHKRQAPDREQIRQTCENRACCNPAHLYLASGPKRLYDQIRVGKPEECWIWTGAKTAAGYGVMTIHRENVLSHRLSWELYHKEKIPDGMHICHSCDNPPCCNPAHLFLGTPKDNHDDAMEKGRVPCGEECKYSKLTSHDVLRLRLLAGAGSPRKRLSAIFKVSRGTIDDIILRKTWKHI